MLIIQRLYLKDFLKLLFLTSIGLSVIFSLSDLIKDIDDFSSIGKLILYSIFIMPKFFLYQLPLSVLICSLFTFSQAFRKKEILAIKTASGRLKKLFYPFIISGILLSFFAFVIGELIVPDFSKRANDLKNAPDRKSNRFTFNEGSLWLKSKDGSLVKIELYIIDKNLAEGVDIFLFGKDFLKERIVAEKAFWNGTTWILENIIKYNIETGKIEQHKIMNYSNIESPDLFAEDIKKPSEMGITELYRYTQRLKNAGFRNNKLIVDLNSKVSSRLINIFMMLIGISFSLSSRFGGGLFSAGLGLLVSLIYWFSYAFMLSLGYAGIIPSYIAAWIIPLLIGMFAVYLFAKIPE